MAEEVVAAGRLTLERIFRLQAYASELMMEQARETDTAGVDDSQDLLPNPLPIVSCLMVTRWSRIDLARRAVACFLAQDYPERELVVVSDDDMAVTDFVPGGQLLAAPISFHRAPAALVLGDLRNFAIARARGQLVAQWDDDDLYHPRRLGRQIARLWSRPDAGGCVLERWTVAWPERDLFFYSGRRAWEGSIVARRWKLPPYPALSRGEDMLPIESMSLCRLDAPDLYIYTVHGANTYDSPHFELIAGGRTATLDGPAAAGVREVIRRGQW